jgi:membrane dipeptidase
VKAPKKYDGYRSFQYLREGIDYEAFVLAPEVNRVPSRRVEVTAEQEARAQRLLDENLVCVKLFPPSRGPYGRP